MQGKIKPVAARSTRDNDARGRRKFRARVPEHADPGDCFARPQLSINDLGNAKFAITIGATHRNKPRTRRTKRESTAAGLHQP